MRNDAVHALQHMLFVGLGINMWMALLGPLPKPAWFGNAAKLGYIVAVRLTSTVLANVFVWSQAAYYSVYAAGEREHGISAQSDQVVAGSIMMVEGSILTLGAVLLAVSAQRARGRGAPGAARAGVGRRRRARRAPRRARGGGGPGRRVTGAYRAGAAGWVRSMACPTSSRSCTELVNSPQAKKLTDKVQAFADDPKTKEQIDKAKRKLAEMREGGSTGGTGAAGRAEGRLRVAPERGALRAPRSG